MRSIPAPARGLALVATLVILACDGQHLGRIPLRPDPGLRGAAPDVLILSVSGHAASSSALRCSSEDNRAYLGDPGDAVEALEAAFTSLGKTVVARHFSDRLHAPEDRPDDPERRGFVDLLDAIDQAHDNWVAGASRPTKIVLVAHSHGTNWAHIATSIRPEVDFEYLISLDGVCFAWECEHREIVREWVARRGFEFGRDIANACDSIRVAGRSGRRSFKDVVFPNVRYNLEVQSIGPPPLADCCDNLRLDASERGIFRSKREELHSTVHLRGTAAMDWVQARITELELVGPP